MARPQTENAQVIARRQIDQLRAAFDTPLNPPALDADGNLPATVLVRTGTAAELDEIVLGDGEIAIETSSGTPVAIRMGDGETAGGVALSASDPVFAVVNDLALRFEIEATGTKGKVNLGVVPSSQPQILFTNNTNSNTAKIEFPGLGSASYLYQLPGVSGIVPVVITKTDTGDPTGVPSALCINTFDNNVKIYADGAWRQLASW